MNSASNRDHHIIPIINFYFCASVVHPEHDVTWFCQLMQSVRQLELFINFRLQSGSARQLRTIITLLNINIVGRISFEKYEKASVYNMVVLIKYNLRMDLRYFESFPDPL